jgi:hypothetical protein
MPNRETSRLLPTAAGGPHRSIILSICTYILTAEVINHQSLSPWTHGLTCNWGVRLTSFLTLWQFCVCLATATLTGSLPIYFRKHLGLDSVTATELNNALQALFNLTPILGAYIADKHIGRFNA